MKYIIIFFLLFSLTGYSKTIEVCSSCKTKSIKTAISLAIDGDTILVKKGLYKEGNIEIEKSIHIIGENNPIVDGEDKGYVFIIKSDNFTLSGFTIKNVKQSYTKDYAAIMVIRSENFYHCKQYPRKMFFFRNND